MQSLNHLNPTDIVFTGIVDDYSSGTAGADPVPSATTATNLVAILEALAGACALIHPAPDGFWDWGYGLAGFLAR